MNIQWNKKNALLSILLSSMRTQIYGKSMTEYKIKNFSDSRSNLGKIEKFGTKSEKKLEMICRTLLYDLPDSYRDNQDFINSFKKAKQICIDNDIDKIRNEESIMEFKKFIELIYKDVCNSSNLLHTILKRIDEICSNQINENHKINDMCRKKNSQNELKVLKIMKPLYERRIV